MDVEEVQEAAKGVRACGCLLTLLVTVPFLVLVCAG